MKKLLIMIQMLVLTTIVASASTMKADTAASENGKTSAVASRPKLIVCIAVDQLRTDYVEMLSGVIGDAGFSRLMQDGLYLRNVDFAAANLDAVSGTVMLMTGEYPSLNGVTSASRYDATSHRMLPIFADNSTKAGNTAYTPEPIRLSTLADEVVIDSEGIASVYGIAADPQMAVALAGHAGASALWISDTNGKWSTSSWYGTLPNVASRRNTSAPLSARLDTMTWRPALNATLYPGLPAQQTYYPFGYTFPRSGRDVYSMVATSPIGNREVTDLAIECLKQIGGSKRTDGTIDMLGIGYTLAPWRYSIDDDVRMELQDAYVRLDGDLARLLDAVNETVGLDNALIMLSSTGYYNDPTLTAEKYRIPGGEFSLKRAASLLNSYLVAKHGNGTYVDKYNDGMLYFDHATLDSKRLSAGVIAADARDFLSKMQGVAAAYTLADILSLTTPETEPLRHSIDPKTAGDLYVEVAPGWRITDDNSTGVSNVGVTKEVRRGSLPTPAFLLGLKVPAKVVTHAIDARALAPTVAAVAGIRLPNGATVKPIIF